MRTTRPPARSHFDLPLRADSDMELSVASLEFVLPYEVSILKPSRRGVWTRFVLTGEDPSGLQRS